MDYNCQTDQHWKPRCHYSDVIMSAMASQITGVGCLLNRFFRRSSKKTPKIHLTKGPVTRKMIPFDDVIMYIRYRCFNGACGPGPLCRKSRSQSVKSLQSTLRLDTRIRNVLRWCYQYHSVVISSCWGPLQVGRHARSYIRGPPRAWMLWGESTNCPRNLGHWHRRHSVIYP